MEIEVNGIKSPVKMSILDSGAACFSRAENAHRLTSDELAVFELKEGGNLGKYSVPSLDVEIRFIVYLYRQDTRFILTDVDGTITESDIKGQRKRDKTRMKRLRLLTFRRDLALHRVQRRPRQRCGALRQGLQARAGGHVSHGQVHGHGQGHSGLPL